MRLSSQDVEEIKKETSWRSAYRPNQIKNHGQKYLALTNAGYDFYDSFHIVNENDEYCFVRPRGYWKYLRPLLIESILSGNGIRGTARLFEVSKITVNNLWKKLKTDDPSLIVNCKCGKYFGHRGWCSYRFQNSEKRKVFMADWHKKQHFSRRYQLLKIIIGKKQAQEIIKREILKDLPAARKCGGEE